MTYDEVIEHTIMEMYKERHSKISDILKPIYLKTISDNEQYHKHKDRIIEIMFNKGLIERINSEHYNLTNFSKSIHEDGGWLKHLADKAEERRMQTELVASSIRTNKLQRPLLWFTVGFSAATFIATIISLVILYMDYQVHEKELRIEEMKSKKIQKEVDGQDKTEKTNEPNQDPSVNSQADSLGQEIK